MKCPYFVAFLSNSRFFATTLVKNPIIAIICADASVFGRKGSILANPPKSSDKSVMELLRSSQDGMRIADLATAMGVTATAVRQRLNRLMDAGHVQRQAQAIGRGRPSHTYGLTEEGRRQNGSNFTDLAIVMWQELRAIKDPEIRRGLLQRVSKRLAGFYADQIQGETVHDRMQSVVGMLAERDIPFEVDIQSDEQRQLPVLKALGCPYTELAEQDRSVCTMERLLLAELVGHGLVLSQCRLDGESCCTFELN